MQKEKYTFDQKLEKAFQNFKIVIWRPDQYFEFLDLLLLSGLFADKTFYEATAKHGVLQVGVAKLKEESWNLGQYEGFFMLLEARGALGDHQFQKVLRDSNVFDIGLEKFYVGTWTAEQYK